MSNGFLPPGYTAPAQNSRYLKLSVGKHKIRILSSAIVASLFWKTAPDGSRHPVRRRPGEHVHPSELGFDREGKPERVKTALIFACWSYASAQVVVAEITQATIAGSLQGLAESEDWGDPREFDITIERIDKNGKTTYGVLPSSKRPLDPAIAEAYRATPVNLEVLYDGGDPFAHGGDGGASGGGDDQRPQGGTIDTMIARWK
jgi:hypothetical protein